MIESADARGTSNPGSILMGFAIGAVVGAGLALLLAPDSGKKTRQRLAATARDWSQRAGRAIDQTRDTVTELGTDAKSALRAGQDAFRRDLAAREARRERRMPPAGDIGPALNSAKVSGEEAAR